MTIAVFDIETNGLLPTVDTVWCAHVRDIKSNTGYDFTPDNINQLCDHLDTYDTLISHNGVLFDFPVLRKVFGWEFKGTKIDTLLISRLQRPNRSKPPKCTGGPNSVEAWAIRLGKEKKVVHEEWDKFSPEMLERCRIDVKIQCDIYEALLKEGEGEGWQSAHKLTSKLFHYLQRQEERGWFVDQEHINFSLYMLDKWMNKISEAVNPQLPIILDILETKKDGEYNYVKKPFLKSGQYSNAVDNFHINSKYNDVNSPVIGPFSRISFRRVDLDKNKEVKDFLLSQGWQPAEWNTNNVGKRTSPKLSKDDPFEGINSKLGKLIARRIQCKARRSILEGWKEKIRADGRIAPEVSGLAVTGRLRHNVVVNVPSKESGAFFGEWMRKCFIATPGWTMVGVDSMGNQIRQLVSHMKKQGLEDKEFTYAVLHGEKEDGTDVHSVNMRRSGVSNRTKAKNFFYGGILFGAGNKKIGQIINASAEEGGRLKAQYYKEVPGIKEVIDKYTDIWRDTAKHYWNRTWNRPEYKDGFIRGLDNRPISVPNEHKVLVSLLQSDESIHMTAAYVMLHKWAKKQGYIYGKDWGSLIFYHDEYQLEGRTSEIAKDIGRLASKAITWAGTFYNIECPHAGEIKYGKNWAETH